MKKIKFIFLLLCFVLVASMTACSEETVKPPVLENILLEYVSLEETDGVSTVTIKWTNNSKDNFSFGKNGTLYVKNGNEFEKIGNVMGDNMLSILQEGESVEVKYTPVDCKLEVGKTYKLEADANFREDDEARTEAVSVEFEVK